MSKVTINGKTVLDQQDYRPGIDIDRKFQAAVIAYQPTPEPSFATHSLIDGQWVAKGSAPASPAPTISRPIGFATPAKPSVAISPTAAPLQVLGSRKEYLRAIEIAAGKTLLAGTNTEAIEAIRRGRLGGRKDNMEGLMQLLRDYSAS